MGVAHIGRLRKSRLFLQKLCRELAACTNDERASYTWASTGSYSGRSTACSSPLGHRRPQIRPGNPPPSRLVVLASTTSLLSFLSRVLVQGQNDVDMAIDRLAFRGGGQSEVDLAVD
jgi:hypothetical protein